MATGILPVILNDRLEACPTILYQPPIPIRYGYKTFENCSNGFVLSQKENRPASMQVKSN
ncbi:MAG: hypothetical protein ACXVAD_11915 [Syntrophales bacterium]